MLLVGILLLAGLAMIIVESPGYNRGGYDSKFWQLPLDDKLDHVAENKRYWWWISVWGLIGVGVMSAGLAGLTHLLANEGEPVLAFVSFGGYLVALMAWVVAMILQAPAVVKAAEERAEEGKTPTWLQPLWDAGYLAEGVWIIGANLAYAAMGLAVLQSGLVGAWAGWVAIVIGLLIPIAIAVTKAGFPQLAEVVPFIVGIALIIESL